jgi:hypothetical protein
MQRKRYIWFLTLVLAVVSSVRTWAGTYLFHPSAFPQEQVWFQCPFQSKETPDRIYLRLSTTGYVLPYINGRIAIKASIWPSRPMNKEGVAENVIDITRLVKQGNNVIALWYAPVIGLKQVPRGMVSAEIYIQHGRRCEVLCDSRSKWMCHLAPAFTRFNGEDFDATYKYNNTWKTKQDFGIDWIPATVVEPATNYPIIPNKALRPYKTIVPVRQVVTDSIATFFLPETVSGQLRVTLRGVKKGDLLHINGMNYKCRGGNDEQFFTRFSTITANRIEISTGAGKPMPSSMNVELIQLIEK